MNYEKMIVNTSGWIKEACKSKKDKWTEFRKFHRFCIENIDKEVAKLIGRFSASAEYNMEINIKSYRWFGLHKKSNPDMKVYQLKDLQKKLNDKLLSIWDDLPDETYSKSDLKKVLNQIDADLKD